MSPHSSPRTLLLTGNDSAMDLVGDLTAPQQAWYAGLHGYAFERVREYEPGTHPSWQKMRLLLERLPHYDFILWLDADVIVTNPHQTVADLLALEPDPDHPRYAAMRPAPKRRPGDRLATAPLDPPCLIVSTDWTWPAAEDAIKHFSLGNFLVSNRPETFHLLRLALQRTEWANQPLWEQQAIQEEYRANPAIRPGVRILPRRALNAVPATPNTTGPNPWQPGDFLCHFTYLPNAERAQRIPGAIVEGFKAMLPALPAWWEPGMCMDARHLCMLREISGFGWDRGLEVGTWTGCTSAAILYRFEQGFEFCDVGFTEEFMQVLANVRRLYRGETKLHQRRSIEVLAEADPGKYDFILLDGDHSLETGIAEAREILRLQPALVLAHDVRSTAAGFGNCEGPAHLHAELLRDGWTVFLDAKDRPGEVTKRGFLAATKCPVIAERLQGVFGRYEF